MNEFLGKICRFEYGKSLPDKDRMPGTVLVYGSNGVIGNHSQSYTLGETIVIGRKGSIGEINLASDSCWPIDTTYYIDKTCTDCDLLWLSFVLKSLKLEELNKGTGVPGLNREDAYKQTVQLPSSIEEQRQIAAKIKAQLGEVETARKALDTQERDVKILETQLLESIFVQLKPEKFVKIGDVAVTTSGSTPSRDKKDYWEPGQYAWIKTGEVAYEPIFDTEESISEKALTECSLTLLPPKTVLVAMYGQGKTRGQSAVLEVSATANQACFAVLPNKTFHPEYLQYWLRHSYSNLRSLSDGRGGNQANLNGAMLKEFTVPLLPKEKQVQLAIVVKNMLDEIDKLKFPSF